MKKVIIVLISVLLSLLICAFVFHKINMDKSTPKKVIDSNITEQTNELSPIEILSNKFDIGISEHTKITYFKSDKYGTKAALVISEEEYNEFIFNLIQSGYGKLEVFERIPKNINDLSQLPSQYAVFSTNRDWMSIYDVSERYSKFVGRIENVIYITDTINGVKEVYLLTDL